MESRQLDRRLHKLRRRDGGLTRARRTGRFASRKMAAHVAAMIGFRTALAAPRALRRVPRSRAARETRGGNDGGFPVVRAEIRRIASPDGTVVDLPNVTFKRPPAVDRAACKSGMMHIGVGGFHRSHQQVRAAPR